MGILLSSNAFLVGSSSKKSLGSFTLIILAPNRADMCAAYEIMFIAVSPFLLIFEPLA